MIYVFKGDPRRSWGVRWTDVSQGFHFNCVVGNMSESEAEAELEKFAARRRRAGRYVDFINERLFKET